MWLAGGLLTLFREAVIGGDRLTRELLADSYAIYVVHRPLVVTLQYELAERGLSAAAAWSIVSGTAVSMALLLAAGLRRMPGCWRVL
ncbi:acyltransferase [Streptomyces sp. NBC_01619]|uniref:Acyltransferase n=1 Tax=Streptomyces pratisoli TaxID=3139917 RepID=A0ACC6QU91_9ACTN|nr:MULTISPECIES: acyltransferase [unclassified Streptomyces]MCX4515607.1 acyltransferase [Streptomyces sp. NBC_01619]